MAVICVANSAWTRFIGSNSSSASGRPSCSSNRRRLTPTLVLHMAPKRELNVASSSAAGHAGSTVWPRDSSNVAADRAAAVHSGATGSPCGWWASRPMRNRPGSAPTSSMYGRAGAGAITASPMAGPRTASSSVAVSRTVRLTQSSTDSAVSSRIGPSEILPWLGFSPTSPQRGSGYCEGPSAGAGVPDRDHAAGDGGGRATAGSAGRTTDIPGVVRSAPGQRFGGRHAAEFGAVGPAGDHQTGAAVATDQRGVGLGDRLLVFERAVAVADALTGITGEQVLDEERHATEWPFGQLSPGGVAGMVEPADDYRVEHGIDALDALDGRFEQLERRHLTLFDQRGLVDRIHPASVIGN